MSEYHKNKGDIGEEYVNELAYNSFIKFWCFPSPKFSITEVEPFNEEKIKQVEEDCKCLNWFQDLKKIEFKEKEYPE